MLFSKNLTLKANKKWGTSKGYVGRERRGKWWWKKAENESKVPLWWGKKIKANIVLMYVRSITCNRGKASVLISTEAAAAQLGLCPPLGSVLTGKLWGSWESQRRTVKSTRGLENMPCSDKLILFSMKTKWKRSPIHERLLHRGRQFILFIHNRWHKINGCKLQ